MFEFSVKKKINKTYELVKEAAEDEDFELNVDLILHNNNDIEKQFTEFYKFLFNMILEAIEKNKMTK